MARAGWISGESQEEAEASIEAERHQVRIVSCREIDLTGLPPLQSGPLPRHWAFVIEDLTPELTAERPQHEDASEEGIERWARQFYLAMATDPELLSSGTIEEFACPSCEENLRIELPPLREKPHPRHFSCPHCRAHLQLADLRGRWEVAPPRQKHDGRCIFCAARADSFEHVIPAWISRRLGIRGAISMRGSIQPRPEPRIQAISFASFRAKIFCSSCNTHFKHLEDEVIPLLVPMAKGVPLAFDESEKTLLSRWCFKTAVALLSAEPGTQDLIPLEQRRALRERGEIPSAAWIGIFRWHGEPTLSGSLGMIASRSRPHAQPRAYGSMLAFEGFGFYVNAYLDAQEAAPRAKDHPPMICIWPKRSGFTNWPPPQTDYRILPGKLFSGWTPLQRD